MIQYFITRLLLVAASVASLPARLVHPIVVKRWENRQPSRFLFSIQPAAPQGTGAQASCRARASAFSYEARALRQPSQLAAQLGRDRVREIVVGQFPVLQQVLDETKAFLRTSRMAMATARFSSTTGDGWIPSSRGVERSDLPPVSGRRGASFGENRRNRKPRGKPRDGKPRDQSARFPNGPE
jgi:hypothetical protein